MKKALILICALIAMPMFYANVSAQDDEDRLIIAGTNDGKVSLEFGTHMGWGYNIVKTNDFKPSGSGEFFINILKLNIYPVDFFGIELGIDYKTIDFVSKEDAFYYDGYDSNKIAKVMPYSQKHPGELTKNFSRLRTNTFSAPLMVKFSADKFKVGAGVEGNLNLTGRIKDKYFQDGKKVKNIDKGIQFNRYSYNFVGGIAYDGTGLYVKYYPKSSKLMPEGGLDVNFTTIGVIFDF